MSLLQIHDPAAAPRAVGIDLGTTHSIVAYVGATGSPVVVEDCDGEALLPSVVHYAAGGVTLVGREAMALAAEHPEDTIVSVKRFMGRSGDDPETHKLGAYRFASEPGAVRFQVADRNVTAVEVSAQILRELKDRAEDELGAIAGAVITVPAYFDDAQRQATKDAARLAGLPVLRLLNEPTAAALAYGLENRKNGRFAVYDLGGGTFDITVLELDDGVFQVRATGGDTQLGGDDVDRMIAERVLEVLGGSRDREAIRRALDAARALKHALTDVEVSEIELAVGGRRAVLRLSRAELAQLAAPLLERTGAACRRALRDAHISADALDGVILVGGSTRMPAVREYVRELFSREPLCDADPDRVVAMGAALQADLLSGSSRVEEVLLLDVLPLSLGIESVGGVVERILPRNTPIPCEAGQAFTTYAENQTGFEIHVVQGERELAADCRSLARFTLRGIPPMPAGLARLDVRFRVDADGLLHVSASERTTNIEQTVEVKPTHGLSEEAIEAMLESAYTHGAEDVMVRALREQRTEAEQVLAATRKAMVIDGELLVEGERTAIEEAISMLERARAGDDHRRIMTAIEELDQRTKPFAGRRMDRAMRAALRGKSVDQLENETAHAAGIDAHLPPERRED